MTDTTQEKLTAAEFYAQFAESNQIIELIHGEVIMPPAPAPLHQQIVGMLHWHLMAAKPSGTIILAPCDVHLDNENVVQPDIFFIAANNEQCTIGEKFVSGAPDLCIEVLSPATAKQDKTIKHALYALHGVREYWIVEATNHYIEVHVLAGDTFELRQTCFQGDSLTSTVLPGLQIEMNAIFGEPS
jgi:Uma2 family endonuclease